MEALKAQLAAGISALGLAISAPQQDSLYQYLCLLMKWNQAYNLTAVRDASEMVNRHLLDSLSVLPYVQPQGRLLDVGSGPGLPGIPLAICYPELKVTTLDSNGKKTRFQQQAKFELGLENLEVVQSRVEKLVREPFDQVISRAFASLEDMLNWSGHLCAPSGVCLAMKGVYPEQELQAIPQGFALKACHSLAVPGTPGERHLLILGRA
ncbi:16S rRNA (guanine(527)-N(7))-methyltransferase RsmG [Nitrincola tapanii]|uniref:Ribosomal RNA small subunit methyltransferase G n=1 Tax=Nitrincola tapanii TaxID=1708751 RepID=A0A5A9VZD4_9GAMM|nr:16S rRNA (guanine(527)-N(7))-methyltransferase RsmG [Nitrincola tapanii]KAA0873753.1 16S rRNA (guanine(527)-N(7))-methyltransferase RsmG [Nitrincola tapanii]